MKLNKDILIRTPVLQARIVLFFLSFFFNAIYNVLSNVRFARE